MADTIPDAVTEILHQNVERVQKEVIVPGDFR
jgi:hypothetical protein